MSKAVDSYEMKVLINDEVYGNKLYMYLVYGNAYGVYITFKRNVIEITKSKVEKGQPNEREYNLEIDALYEELEEMSDEEIRNLIQSKLSLKKFDL